MQPDPMAHMLAPPHGETLEQLEQRLQREAEAKRRSDRIDDDIRRERDTLRHQNVLRMLLLGQSGSGKKVSKISAYASKYFLYRQIHDFEE